MEEKIILKPLKIDEILYEEWEEAYCEADEDSEEIEDLVGAAREQIYWSNDE